MRNEANFRFAEVQVFTRSRSRSSETKPICQRSERPLPLQCTVQIRCHSRFRMPAWSMPKPDTCLLDCWKVKRFQVIHLMGFLAGTAMLHGLQSLRVGACLHPEPLESICAQLRTWLQVDPQLRYLSRGQHQLRERAGDYRPDGPLGRRPRV